MENYRYNLIDSHLCELCGLRPPKPAVAGEGGYGLVVERVLAKDEIGVRFPVSALQTPGPEHVLRLCATSREYAESQGIGVGPRKYTGRRFQAREEFCRDSDKMSSWKVSRIGIKINWCARRDSNPQPPRPKRDALSIALRARFQTVLSFVQFYKHGLPK